MKIEFDPVKSNRNLEERGLSFDGVDELDWSTAIITEDTRYDYGEKRYRAVGRIGERAHVVVFTPIQDGIRVISFRKANPREVKRYEQTT